MDDGASFGRENELNLPHTQEDISMHILTGLILLMTFQTGFASDTPEATLEQYFGVLTGQDFSGISQLMDTESMMNLKTIMDDAIGYQANHGVYRLQRRIFGRKVSMSDVSAATADFYLESLAGEILEAARAQHLVVDDRVILGHIDETEDLVHIVARLNMHQDDTRGSDVLVYTLIREEDGWKLKFPATIKQMLTVIETSARRIH
ncbi:MAG: hypothetical protein JJ957_08445 [Pseudomonadales bacterium]|nr:hypothetical protein [Pseudomonadales bacterium]